MATLKARSFRAEDLVKVEPWFDDAETRRWLGDRTWPRRLLELARQSDRVALLYSLADEPVGLLDIELYADGTAAVAVIVSPDHRRRGLATAILRSLFHLPQTGGVDRIIGEVEVGNVAGERCVRAAGFEPCAAVVTHEGFIRFASRR